MKKDKGIFASVRECRTPDDRAFFRAFFSMTAVIALQNLITFGLGLADNIMIGGYSEAALSGAAMANELQFLLQMTVMGIGNGLTVFTSRFWGKRDTDPIKKYFAVAFYCALFFSCALGAAARFCPEAMLSLLTDEAPVLSEAAKYLRITGISFPFFAVTNILLALLRSVETVKIGFYVSCFSLGANIVMNSLFIYGRAGFPEMGIEGAALATLISRLAECGILLFYTLRADKKLCMKFRDFFRTSGEAALRYFRVGFPLALASISWGIATFVRASIIGHVGGELIAANAITNTAFQIASFLGYASSNATAVLIAKLIGEGKREKVRPYSYILQGIYILIGLATGAAIFFSRGLMLRFYNITDATAALANTLMLIIAVDSVGSFYQVPCLNGIVTGGGHTKYVLKNDLIFQWLIVIPSAALSAFVFHFSPVTVFICLKADQLLKCIPAAVTVNRFRFIRTVTAKEE